MLIKNQIYIMFINFSYNVIIHNHMQKENSAISAFGVMSSGKNQNYMKNLANIKPLALCDYFYFQKLEFYKFYKVKSNELCIQWKSSQTK